MKTLKKLTFIFGAIFLIGTYKPAFAQSDIDTGRMNRDINIMENILDELFDTSMQTDGSTVRVGTGSFFRFGGSDIRGTYLPNYGIIFTIPGGPPPFLALRSGDSDFSYQFRYDSENDGREITREAVINRMTEFLREYASTIGQLGNDQKVMVLYRPENRPRIVRFLDSDDNEDSDMKTIPTISTAASVSNLKAYRAGKLSNEDFHDRLDINVIEKDSEPKDIRVMTNILKTAFKNSESGPFRIVGDVEYLQLKDFGALFSFDVRPSGSGILPPPPPRINIPDVKREKGKISVEVRRMEREDSTMSKNREERKKEIEKAYETFISDLKEYIVDYGRTLHSVSSDQHILFAVQIRTNFGDIPERINMQIQKSVLESVDSGNMSRDQAMNRIEIREY